MMRGLTILLLATLMACAQLVSAAPLDPSATTTPAPLHPAQWPVLRERAQEQQQPVDQQEDDLVLTSQNTGRLMRELRQVNKCDAVERGLMSVGLVDGEIHRWVVSISRELIYGQTALTRDLAQLAQEGKPDHLLLRMDYGPGYPAQAPQVEVVYPKLKRDKHPEDFPFCSMIEMGARHWNSEVASDSLIVSSLASIMARDLRINFNKTNAALRMPLSAPATADDDVTTRGDE